jgi:hypothetical protein
VLAAGDERAFLAFVLELLASPQRLDREAALEALVERPLDGARDALRRLYFDLHNTPKGDRGGDQRGAILRYLIKDPHPRDVEVAALASGTFEFDSGGADSTFNLRRLALQLLAHVTPEHFPYYCAEHLDDIATDGRAPRDDGEPAATAIGLLAGFGQLPMLYHWLRRNGPGETNFMRAFDAFTQSPPEIVRRYINEKIEAALLRSEENVCMAFADAIVKLELEQAYPLIGNIMDARISDELYSYMAVLAASTNRPRLLAVLEEQLRPGSRTHLVIDALSIRTTPEQQAILDRWEER